MLKLTRAIGEKIVIHHPALPGGKVKLWFDKIRTNSRGRAEAAVCIEADRGVSVDREEVYQSKLETGTIVEGAQNAGRDP